MTTLPGSERKPMPGAVAVGPVHPDVSIEVTVHVRPGDAHQRTTDLLRVTECLRRHDLVPVRVHEASGSVVLAGDAIGMEGAFGVVLDQHEHPEHGGYRGHSGPIRVPDAIAGVVTAVLGLDNRPVARPHFRRHVAGPARQVIFDRNANTRDVYTLTESVTLTPPANLGSFLPTQLRALYGYPADVNGWQQTIGLIELGGGYRAVDIQAYFARVRPDLPTPTVVAVPVDQARNAPSGDPDGPDGEVMLDIEVAAGICPKATIVVYFAPNTDRGFLDAINVAIHDPVHRPGAIAISWGGPEPGWSGQALAQFDRSFQAAGIAGVTVCVAAGDDGSDDGVGDGRVHVDFPASSPHVLACGGTRLVSDGRTIASEVAWNDGAGHGAGGGGFSAVFPLPGYQVIDSPALRGVARRGVPDVAADADPATGYQVRVDGRNLVFGGTSAVSPLYAGLVTLLNQKLGRRLGFVNPLFYQHAAAFRDVIRGNNGDYVAGPGWDPCTGLGVADGLKLLRALEGT